MAYDTKQVSAIVSNTPSINNSQTTIKGNNQISTDNRTITEFSKINVIGVSLKNSYCKKELLDK